MSYRVALRAAAKTDLRDARDWYEQARSGLGDEFLAASADAFIKLEESAARYPVYYNGFRRLLMGRFPYRVFFRVEGDEVIVFRILHAARDHTTQL